MDPKVLVTGILKNSPQQSPKKKNRIKVLKKLPKGIAVEKYLKNEQKIVTNSTAEMERNCRGKPD